MPSAYEKALPDTENYKDRPFLNGLSIATILDRSTLSNNHTGERKHFIFAPLWALQEQVAKNSFQIFA